MDLTKTKEQLEKELANDFPHYPASAIESLAYLTHMYYKYKNINTELKSQLELRDAELRLECLKLTEGMFPDININEVQLEGNTKYYCRLPKYRSELANKYFYYLKTGHPVEISSPFWECDDWVSTSED